jgi:hypothetical protein
MELDPAEGEEAEDCLEDRLADAHHAGGEGRAHCRTQELRVRQHATTHWKRNRKYYFLLIYKGTVCNCQCCGSGIGSGSFSRIRIRKKNSGSEMNLKSNYVEKLINMTNFSTKLLI